MGLPMNNIHSPTVASGATSTTQNDEKKMSVQELMTEKDRVWSELSALGSVLDSHNVTMTTSLTTFDGYPRPDIDVAQIRTTRARIIRLKNDYKNLMVRIEVALEEHWASPHSAVTDPATSSTQPTGPSQAPSSLPTETSGRPPQTQARLEVPFAKVNSVVSSSPADVAGLKTGDKITKFADVDWTNHEKLAKVAQAVQQNEGREFTVKIIRSADLGGGEERLELKLTPRHNWGGRGMLGCHLLPL